MLTFRKVRSEARQVSRDVQAMLRDDSLVWESRAPIGHEDTNGCVLTTKTTYGGRLNVTIMPCNGCCAFLRIFDRCYLNFDGADVFVPLLSRMRLRTAARYRMLRIARRRY